MGEYTLNLRWDDGTRANPDAFHMNVKGETLEECLDKAVAWLHETSHRLSCCRGELGDDYEAPPEGGVKPNEEEAD